jgi:hypothetical protein
MVVAADNTNTEETKMFTQPRTLDVDKQGSLPVAPGGRGDVDGSYDDPGAIIVGLYGNWRF